MQADTVGGIAPAVLVTLRPGEKVLAAHGLMLYKEQPVQVHRRTMKSLGVSRTHLMGMHAMGDSEESYFFAEFEGPGHVSFSRDKGGEVRVLHLAPGQTLRLRDGHLICFDESVRYYPMVLAQYPAPVPDANGQRPVTYLFADELTGPGTIVYQSYGNILSFDLKPGEAMRTSVSGLLAAANTVQLRVDWLAGPAMATTGPTPLPVLDLVGPGTVLVHSGE
ncbi:MAG TPA: AIM24 family protein [Thermoplasmata archaeon]|nr:AIM24 family protein [Thermoplasmata archaeon]